jgi:hypothetical protein
MLAALLGGSIQSGVAPHYAPGVMERVADIRGMPRVDCMVSSPIYPIGDWVYVYGVSTQALRYCQVTDTSQTRDRARHIRTHRIVELDYKSTIALCGTTRDRPEQCPVVVVKGE